MSFAADGLACPGRTAQVQATAVVRAMLDSSAERKRLTEEAPAKLEALRAAAAELVKAGHPLGRREVGDWFTIRIVEGADAPNGIVGFAVWEGTQDERRAVRIATLVEQALDQMPQSLDAAVLIDVGDVIDVAIVGRELHRRALIRPVFFSPLRFVALRWRQRVSPYRTAPTGGHIILRGPLVASEIRLAQVLLR